MNGQDKLPLVWLAKKYLDECSLQFRTVWDLYLKFYVLFLTVNGAALGLTVQYVHDAKAKAVIAVAFFLQNALAAGTAVMMARFSSNIARRAQGLAELAVTRSIPAAILPLPAVLAESPLPGHLGWWGGVANLLGHVVFGLLWLAVIFLSFGP